MKKGFWLFWCIFLITQLSAQSLTELSTDFKAYGLREGNTPEKWEDGMRTNGEKGSFEWWYFDAHLEDGSTVVIVFYTKPFTRLQKGLTPYISVNIERADGSEINRSIKYDPHLFSASKDSCNVQIGTNYFRGNLESYTLHFQDEELKIDAHMKRTVDSWRPGTGRLTFGQEKEDYFAWFAPLPQGNVDMEITYKNNTIKTKGSCYHDHNWGNKSLTDLFNHWYWSRAEIGPYNVIAAEMITEKDYNNESWVVFNISKAGKVVADDQNLVKAYRSYGVMDEQLKKDVSNDLSFVYEDQTEGYTYHYSLHREKNIAEVDLLQGITGGKNLKYRLAQLLTGFNGAYFRFAGTAKLKVFKEDVLIETYTSSTAVWELMYLGDAYRD